MKGKQKITLESLARQMQKGFTQMGRRFDVLENRLERYATAAAEDAADVSDKIDILSQKVDGLDTEVGNGFSEVKMKMDEHDTRISGVQGLVISPNSHRLR